MSEMQTTRVLEYGTESTERHGSRRIALAVLALSLLAVAACFVPFTSESRVSPWELACDAGHFLSLSRTPAFDVTILLGLSFLMAFPVVLWKVRLLFFRRPRRWQRLTALVVTVLGSLPLTAFFAIWARVIIRDIRNSDLVLLAVIFFVGIGIPLTALVLAAKLKKRRQPDAAIEVLLMSPFLANGAMCLIGFGPHREIGWWLTLLVEFLWLAQWIAWFMARKSPAYAPLRPL